MKKILILVFTLFLITGCAGNKEQNILKALPEHELESGQRGSLGIEKNLNENNIDDFLNREDSVYFDMRLLNDPAAYENIGGSSMLTGYIKGFEIFPYPYLCEVKGLPEEVGSPYTGQTLFSIDEDNKYIPNFKESVSILESVFPKDKNIFLMCGGGGYAGMTKELLVANGWDSDKIWNVGGYWNYNGKNKIEISQENSLYKFSDLNYYEIDFSNLTPADYEEKETNLLYIDGQELSTIEKRCEYFALYIYAPGCVNCAYFQPILQEYLEKNNMTFYAISSQDFSTCDSMAKDCIQYTPSVVIYNKGKVLYTLDPSKDSDVYFYESVEHFSEWMNDKTEEYCLGEEGTCSGYCTVNKH